MGRPAADVGQETSTLVTQAVTTVVGVEKILSWNRRQVVSLKVLQSAAEFGNGRQDNKMQVIL